MAHEISWQQPNRIIKVVVDGDQSIEDLGRISDELVAYLAQGQPPVHVLSDARTMGKFPVQLNAVKEINERWLRHPNVGWTVVVSKSNPVLNFLAATVTHIIHVNYRMVATPEEALEVLRLVDNTLPVEQP
jgi:hypothetical protein